jgi:hypothetical protein
MARYGQNFGGYDRGQGARRSRYGGDFGGRGYDRSYARGGYGGDYEGGWGMTNLSNTIMHRGARGRDRYAQEFYHRPKSAPYSSDFERDRYGTEFRSRVARQSPDAGSVGVHYRGTSRGRY